MNVVYVYVWKYFVYVYGLKAKKYAELKRINKENSNAIAPLVSKRPINECTTADSIKASAA